MRLAADRDSPAAARGDDDLAWLLVLALRSSILAARLRALVACEWRRETVGPCDACPIRRRPPEISTTHGKRVPFGLARRRGRHERAGKASETGAVL